MSTPLFHKTVSNCLWERLGEVARGAERGQMCAASQMDLQRYDTCNWSSVREVLFFPILPR